MAGGVSALPVGPLNEPPERLEELLRAAARGDRVAFDAAYARVGGPVYGLVLRLLRDHAQAEEVAQEAAAGVARSQPFR